MKRKTRPNSKLRSKLYSRPNAEQVTRGSKKSFSKSALAIAVSSALLSYAPQPGAEVPIACAGGSCISGGKAYALPRISEQGDFVYDAELNQWVGEHSKISKKTLAGENEELLIEQFTDSAFYEWRSFDIASGHRVVFSQPDSSSIAVNRITDVYPSEIFGALEANGQVYLFNRSGIIFGPDSQINVATLLASSLEVPDIDGGGLVDAADYEQLTHKGLLSYFQEQAVGEFGNGQLPALVNRDSDYQEQLPQSYEEVEGPGGTDFVRGGIWLHQGSEIRARDYGKVMLFGTEVVNAGLISTPNGQAILAAAKDQAWVEPVGGDFIVNVKGGGVVSNLGEIIAERGNVSLIGMAVNQQGAIRATTSIDFDGSIVLRAEDTVLMREDPVTSKQAEAVLAKRGDVVLGTDSLTEVALELDAGGTAIDSQVHEPSKISVRGARVFFEKGSNLLAKNGDIDVFADIPSLQEVESQSLIEIADDVRIDVSGADSVLPVESVVAKVVLTGNELADFPAQKNSGIKGKTVYFDSRKVEKTEYANGEERYLLPFADVTGVMQARKKTLSERASDAGTLTLDAQMGEVVLKGELNVDVSAGITQYTEGAIETTLLVDEFGAVVPVHKADGDIAYSGVFGEYSRTFDKWGVEQKWSAPWSGQSTFEKAYASYNGASAGEVGIVGTQNIKGLGNLTLEVRQQLTVLDRKKPLPGATLSIGGAFEHTRLAEQEVSLGAPSIKIVDDGSFNEKHLELQTWLDARPEQELTDVIASTHPDASEEDAVVDDSVVQTPEPAGDDLVDDDRAVYLSPEFVTRNSIANLSLSSNAEIVLDDGVEIDLPIGGQFTSTSPAARLLGDIKVPSGSVAVNIERPAPSLEEGEAGSRSYHLLINGADINVSGTWVNDLLSGETFPNTKLALDGGRIDFNWEGDGESQIVFAGDNRFVASAGAWMTQEGDIRGGDGGSIRIALGNSENDENSEFMATGDAHLSLEAFGQTRGGSFELQAPEIMLGEGELKDVNFVTRTASEQESEQGPLDNLSTHLRPIAVSFNSEFFESSGFENIKLINTFSDLVVPDEAQFTFSQKNQQFKPELAEHSPDSPDLPAFIQPKHAYLRRPVNFELSLENDDNNQGYTLDLGTGSSFVFDTGAEFRAVNKTAGAVYLDGSIQAKAGVVALESGGVKSSTSFYPEDGFVWLGDNSMIDVSANVIDQPKPLVLPNKKVFDGGEVSLQAGGYLVMDGGRIDVSGTRAEVTLEGRAPEGDYIPETDSTTVEVGSDAGLIRLEANEGIVLNGAFNAVAGSDTNAGGALIVVMDPARRAKDNFGKPLGPDVARRIELVAQDEYIELEVLPEPDPVADEEHLAQRFSADLIDEQRLNGRAVLSTQELTQAGFWSLSFSTGITAEGFIDLGEPAASMPRVIGNTENTNDISEGIANTVEQVGEAEPVLTSLSLLGSVAFETGVINVRGDTHIRAPHIALSGAALNESQISAGEGRLTLSANYLNSQKPGLIELSRTRLSGLDELTLQTSGDIRLKGDVVAPGSITLDARQVYPVTNVNEVVAQAPGVKALTFEARDGDATTPAQYGAQGELFILSNHRHKALPPLLAAAGHAEFTADSIYVDGVVRSPFGDISFDTKELTLDSGAVVSVSADDADILFSPILSGIDAAAFPKEPRVTINAEVVDVNEGAVVDLSGGGDLLNWGFVRSASGSQDILLPAVSTNTFAIVPSQDLSPYNDRIAAVEPGRSVTIAEGSGLPAGTYTLLPARYALLEGAWLVREEQGFKDLMPGVGAQLQDGTAVVSGFYSSSFNDARTQRYSGFSLRPQTELVNFSEYQIERASESEHHSPEDAASLEISAAKQMNLSGDIIGDHISGAKGISVSISADQLRVVTEGDEGSVGDTFVELIDTQLQAMNASRLLIGGRRVREESFERIETTASDVELMNGTRLQAEELLVAAKQSITMHRSVLSNQESDAQTENLSLVVADEGALVGVSNRSIRAVSRKPGEGQAAPEKFDEPRVQVFVDDRARIQSSNSLVIDSPYHVSLKNAVLEGERVFLSAEGVALGSSPTDSMGLSLSNDNLQSLSAAKSLVINTANDLSFYGDARLSGANLALSLQAPALINQGEGDLFIDVQSLVLSNPYEAKAASVASDNNTAAATDPSAKTVQSDTQDTSLASLRADDIVISEGVSTIQGWGQLLSEAERLLLDGRGALDLSAIERSELTLGQITSGSSARSAISGRSLVLGQRQGQGAAGSALDGLGGALNIHANDLIFDTSIRLASGSLSLNASEGDINVGSNANIDLSGVSKAFYSESRETWGGEFSAKAANSVLFAEGSSVNVSGAGTREAGRVDVQAGLVPSDELDGVIVLGGHWTGSLASNHKGASASFAANAIVDEEGGDAFAPLNQLLNQSGFNVERQFLLRTGNVVLGAGAEIKSETIRVAVDGGELDIQGRIVAESTNGGRIELLSRGDLRLGSTAILSAKGGDIALRSYAGARQLANEPEVNLEVASASLDDTQASGILLDHSSKIILGDDDSGRTGELVLTALRSDAVDDTAGPSVNLALLAGNGQVVSMKDIVSGARQVVVEGLKVTELGPAAAGATELGAILNSEFTAAKTFYQAIHSQAAPQSPFVTGLGFAGEDNVTVVPAIELRVGGHAQLKQAAAIDPIALTNSGRGSLSILASGDLNLESSFSYQSEPEGGWSYHLRSGSTQSIAPWDLGAGGGDLKIAKGKTLVTGSGDIILASSGNVDISGRVATIGNTIGAVRLSTATGAEKVLGRDGGDLTVNALGSITGSVGDSKHPWFSDGLEHVIEKFREGRVVITTGNEAFFMNAPTAVGGTSFNLSSLAGGDLVVHAGGGVSELSAGSFTAFTINEGAIDEFLDSGDLSIYSSGAIDSSMFMSGNGNGDIYAGDGFGSSFTYEEGRMPAYSVVAMQQGQVGLRAAGSIALAGATNTTLPYALTYGEHSALTMDALAGDVSIHAKELDSGDFNFVTEQASNHLQWFPGRLQATAYQGDVQLAAESNVFLSPSASGTISLIAEQNVHIGGENDFGFVSPATVYMSELDPEAIPFLGEGNEKFRLVPRAGHIFTTFGPESRLVERGLTPLHAEQTDRSTIIALEGDYVSHAGSNDQINVRLPTELLLFAGGSILEPKINVKHSRVDSVSQIIAQGDMSDVNLEVEGPGRLDVAAGGDMTFVVETSGVQGSGVTSLGGTQDSRLSGYGGSDINIYVGVTPQNMSWTSFVDPYIASVGQWDKLVGDLRAFVDEVSSELKDPDVEPVSSLSDYQVLQRYLEIPVERQLEFSSSTFSSEVEKQQNLQGLALSLEVASLIGSSNYAFNLASHFSNPEEGHTSDLQKLFIDSIRVFRDSEFYSHGEPDVDGGVLTFEKIVARVDASGLTESEVDSQFQFFDIFPEEAKRKIIERSFLMLSESERRQIAFETFSDLESIKQQDLILGAFYGQLRDSGRLSNRMGKTAFDIGFRAIDELFPQSTYLGEMQVESEYRGDLTMDLRRVYSFDGGDLNFIVPGGTINAGDPSLGVQGAADETGVVTVEEGDIRSFTHGGFLVNQSRVQTIGGGNILMWASEGDLNAGRGARTALSAPAPEISIGEQGQVVVNLGAAISGSGIRQVNVLSTDDGFESDPKGVKPEKGIDLIAPNGSVDAGESGIFAAGNLSVAAEQVVNAEFIEVGGAADGVPGAGGDAVPPPAPADDVSGQVAKDATEKIEKTAAPQEQVLSSLEVKVLEFGEGCEDSADSNECVE